jgi:hypothetical protein
LQQRIDAIHGKDVTIKVLADASGPGGISGPAAYLVSPGGGFSEGGFTGPGGKYDPAGLVHRGEVVWSQSDVAAHGGVQQVEAMRRSRGMPGFADGGAVGVNVKFDTRVADGVVARTAKALLEPATGLVGALNWARTQVGKPYIWGGVGPTGYDCSGFMSAITNVIRGRNPYSRVGSTANFPWAGFAGGYGQFTIGSTPNAGGGIGHMAGTLLGVNVESTGNHVRVGGDARGASNGLFSTRAHLAMANGGVIGEPVSGIGHYSGRSYSFGERGPETVTPGLPGGGPSHVSLQLDGRAVASLLRGEVVSVLSGVNREMSGRGVR